MMKGYWLFCQLSLLCSMAAYGQFTAGPGGIFIGAGTAVYIDGLTLTPSSDFTAASRTLTVSPTPIPGSPPGIARVYQFDQPVNFAGNVGFYYQPGELNGNAEETLQLNYGTAGAYTSVPGSTVDDVAHYISNTLPAVTSFDGLTAAQEGALPVRLADFVVRKTEHAVMLYWQTTSEENSAFFEVQQSRDAAKWNVIGKVTAANQGSKELNYTFRDNAPRSGLQYYRLKMVDTDGTFAYSIIRSLQLGHTAWVNAYPNPAVNLVRVDMADSKETASLKVVNLAGKPLFESQKEEASHEVNMESFPAGIYLFLLKTASGKTEAVKIIKQ